MFRWRKESRQQRRRKQTDKFHLGFSEELKRKGNRRRQRQRERDRERKQSEENQRKHDFLLHLYSSSLCRSGRKNPQKWQIKQKLTLMQVHRAQKNCSPKIPNNNNADEKKKIFSVVAIQCRRMAKAKLTPEKLNRRFQKKKKKIVISFFLFPLQNVQLLSFSPSAVNGWRETIRSPITATVD